MPRAIHLPLALAAAALAGGVWGAVPGILKARTGAHEVITTIMLNYLAFRLSTVIISADDQLSIVNPALQATEPALPAARLPGLVTDTRLHAGLVLAVAAAVVLWYGMFRTSWGYRLRTVGLSRGAAAYAGISWGRTITVAMLVSGLLGGLAGASEDAGSARALLQCLGGLWLHRDRGRPGWTQSSLRRDLGRVAVRCAE